MGRGQPFHGLPHHLTEPCGRGGGLVEAPDPRAARSLDLPRRPTAPLRRVGHRFPVGARNSDQDLSDSRGRRGPGRPCRRGGARRRPQRRRDRPGTRHGARPPRAP
ncbi:hypothetical protein SBRY_30573 [Actinacidiphila bryophytorum]|uniref:Uncharacterized protein n=1 Tax=Actinacidiphila bryophytorum TaxID=1436133 RepID=A0A9W4MBL7_9ACTN|nr:hypothetical protein SBRY_30573 [Actinacidiphila bryophytorum]